MIAGVIPHYRNAIWCVHNDLMSLTRIPSRVPPILLHYQVFRVVASGVVAQVTDLKANLILLLRGAPIQLVSSVGGDQGEDVQVCLLQINLLMLVVLQLRVCILQIRSLVPSLVCLFIPSQPTSHLCDLRSAGVEQFDGMVSSDEVVLAEVGAESFAGCFGGSLSLDSSAKHGYSGCALCGLGAGGSIGLPSSQLFLQIDDDGFGLGELLGESVVQACEEYLAVCGGLRKEVLKVLESLIAAEVVGHVEV